jgi:hypothetical protein
MLNAEYNIHIVDIKPLTMMTSIHASIVIAAAALQQ